MDMCNTTLGQRVSHFSDSLFGYPKPSCELFSDYTCSRSLSNALRFDKLIQNTLEIKITILNHEYFLTNEFKVSRRFPRAQEFSGQLINCSSRGGALVCMKRKRFHIIRIKQEFPFYLFYLSLLLCKLRQLVRNKMW